VSKSIIINNTLTFQPGKKILIKEGVIEKVSGPASSCLELLIEKKGQVCTYAELYNHGWKRFGMEVSSATLHQHIALLRKSLRILNVDPGLIRTISRCGFMVPENIVISIEQIKLDPSFVTSENEELKNELDSSIDNSVSKKTIAKKIKIRSPIYKKNIFYLIGCAFIVLLILSYKWILNNKNNSYYLYKEDSSMQCKIFINNYISLPEKNISNLIKQFNISCKPNKLIYVTSHKLADRISVFSCENDIYSKKKSNCDSFYYIRESKGE